MLTAGKIAVRTLASKDGKYYTEIGYDLSNADMPFYVDHSHCCTAPNNITQRAILAKTARCTATERDAPTLHVALPRDSAARCRPLRRPRPRHPQEPSHPLHKGRVPGPKGAYGRR